MEYTGPVPPAPAADTPAESQLWRNWWAYWTVAANISTAEANQALAVAMTKTAAANALMAEANQAMAAALIESKPQPAPVPDPITSPAPVPPPVPDPAAPTLLEVYRFVRRLQAGLDLVPRVA